uniref:LEPR-XLL domain-containing protein n=1 Tax=Flavobacterium pallidum TaxID=2172098 RepID=UPI003743F477
MAVFAFPKMLLSGDPVPGAVIIELSKRTVPLPVVTVCGVSADPFSTSVQLTKRTSDPVLFTTVPCCESTP